MRGAMPPGAWVYGVVTMPSDNYDWSYLLEGDAEYPESHRELVDAIDESVASVAGSGYDLTADMSASAAREAINSADPDTKLRIEPGASWTLPGPLQPAAGVKISGETTKATDPTFVKGFDGGALVEPSDYCEFEHLWLYGDRSSGVTGDGINFDGVRECAVRNCTVNRFAGDGVVMRTFFTSVDSCTIRKNGGFGVRFPDESTGSGENPHSEIIGPTYIGYNDEGGIRFRDTRAGGKNVTIHAWIGHNSGPGIHADGTWKSLDIMAQWANNEGPAWLQTGGNMRVTLQNPVMQNNAQSPDSGLTAPAGQIHVEDGSLDATISQPFVTPASGDASGPPAIASASSTRSSVALVMPSETTFIGDITGSVRLAATDISAHVGDVDVESAIAVDSAAETVRTGGDLSGTVGVSGFSGDHDDLSGVDSDDHHTKTREPTGGVVATLSANQSIPDSTVTQVAFDTTTGVDDGSLDASANEVVVPDDGVYDIAAAVSLDEAGNGTRIQLRLHAGGERVAFPDGTYNGKATLPTPVSTGATADLSAGDAVYLEIYHDAGGARDLVNGAEKSRLRVRRVA